ncbi:spindle and kinetochore-associated protein 3 [Suncus etruscus]|uniref:spindle and kinetochore-associated protein 3 n=1 Tax=Suncus etruscus TaxID=109475 RepID=UPI00210F56F4|nr:spindle and kinetochore-associated protein 3 [Suncus etruscus]
MEQIRSFCGKLRALAFTLDQDTARLQRALQEEEPDSEDYPLGILTDLCSEVQSLKDDVNNLFDNASLESQESIRFIKATKVLMKKNSMDIMKISEYFQKYGYNLRVKENSVDEHNISESKLESAEHENFQKSDLKDDLSDATMPSSCVSENSPRSPQLSDFGLERYMILPNLPQAINNNKEEPEIITPSSKESLVSVPKTPKCTLKMDDFECVTPKLEHFGISEYTMCLNEDYTMGLKNVKKCKGATQEDLETEEISNDKSMISPGPIIQQLGTKTAEHMNSPLAPTFCTPGLKIPSTKNIMALMSTSCPLSEKKSSADDLEIKDCTSLTFDSDECFKKLTSPSPNISSYENLLQTPTPPDVTTIPEDVLQILSKYSSNLATPAAVKAVPPVKTRLIKYEKQNTQDISNKENW